MQQICIYSLYLFSLFWVFIFDLIKYSTALTSCLVIFSNSLTFLASEIVKLSYNFSKKDFSFFVNFGRPLSLLIFDKCINHFTSTNILDFIRLYSENTSDIEVVIAGGAGGTVIVNCAKVSGYGSQQHQDAPLDTNDAGNVYDGGSLGKNNETN